MSDEFPLSPDKPSTKLDAAIENDSKNDDSGSSNDALKLANKILQQRLRHRTFTFYGVIGVCCLLYLSFGIFLWKLHSHMTMLEKFAANPHLTAFLLALLIVPSALLWGTIRAVFRVGKPSVDIDVVKAITSAHPLM